MQVSYEAYDRLARSLQLTRDANAVLRDQIAELREELERVTHSEG